MTQVFVPAGSFTMGSNSGTNDERPVHTVTLDAFWIDKTEVTNAMYALCVKTGQCSAPSQTRSAKNPSYFGNSQFDLCGMGKRKCVLQMGESSTAD